MRPGSAVLFLSMGPLSRMGIMRCSTPRRLFSTSGKEELSSLRRELGEHDELYYNVGRPRVSDAEYDALKERAVRLEAMLGTTSEVGRKVGVKRTGAFHAAKPHLRRLLSLENLKLKKGEAVEAGIDRWLAKARKAATKGGAEDSLYVVAEPKLDGLSVALRYAPVTGRLVSAATRGDGTQGDDVTMNAMQVSGIPHLLEPAPSAEIEVRGEVMMRRSTFLAVQNFTSPRNAAAGSLRNSDATTTAARNLSFFAHDVVSEEDEEESWSLARERLTKWGFECPKPWDRASSAAELREYYESAQEDREDRDLEIDGVVYKLDAMEARKCAGTTAKAPRWAVAHKFEAAVVAATTLKEISVSVGKRGGLTPVAKLEPVSVGDVTVSSATLHNAAQVRATLKGVRLGDSVLVKRAGDVIPQIVPRETSQVGDFDDWRLPETCPSCGTPTVFLEDDEDSRYCPAAYDCPAQARERLAHFFSRSALDLGAGVGKKKLEQLVDHRIVRTPADLLALDDVDVLAKLDGWGAKSAQKLLDAIERRKSTPVPYAKFLVALGAPRIGQTVAAKLAKDSLIFPDLWDGLRQDDPAVRTALAQLPGVGTAAIDAFAKFASDSTENDAVLHAASLLQLDFDLDLRTKSSTFYTILHDSESSL